MGSLAWQHHVRDHQEEDKNERDLTGHVGCVQGTINLARFIEAVDCGAFHATGSHTCSDIEMTCIRDKGTGTDDGFRRIASAGAGWRW